MQVLDGWMPADLDGTAELDLRALAACIDLACAPERQVRLVMVVEDDALAGLRARFPRLAAFTEVRVPAIGDAEVLPLWLCQLPVLEDRWRTSVYLPQIASSRPALQRTPAGPDGGRAPRLADLTRPPAARPELICAADRAQRGPN